MPDRPLLRLPQAEDFTPRRSGGGGSPIVRPTRARQRDRLNPTFARLARVAESPRQLAELRRDPAAIAPERAIVFEVEGYLDDFYTQAKDIGLDYLADYEENYDPTDDFYNQEKREKPIGGRVYLAMPDVAAIRELLSLWNIYAAGDRMPNGRGQWTKLFSQLIEVRAWGPQDRVLPETLEAWQDALDDDPGAPVRFEIELWFQSSREQRSAAHRRLRRDIGRIGGSVIDHTTVEDIHYDAMLVDVPAAEVQALIDHPDVGLAQSDDVMFLRPQSVAGAPAQPPEGEDGPVVAPAANFMDDTPIAALLDGLPIENHMRLAGRLDVDDPDDLGQTVYTVELRQHGTEMASLIVHGDLNRGGDPISRPLHVRPVMEPQTGGGGERTPANRLLVDVIHQAVRRIKVGIDGEAPTAPDVVIINLSLGDEKRPFSRVMSPLGRLLDYLSWHYRILFLVSAGNILDRLPVPGFATWTDFENATPEKREEAVLHALNANKSMRTLFSPAEAMNVLTIGAAHAGSGYTGRFSADRIDPFTADDLPNIVSALGLGFRKVVKPELLFEGGRAPVMMASTGGGLEVRPALNGVRFFGVKAAKPAPSGGGVAYEDFTWGTSAATALATRAAHRIYDVIWAPGSEANRTDIPADHRAIALKALLVHGARWGDKGTMLDALFGPQGRGSHFERRDDIARLLGYGLPDVERVLDCTENRATLLGTGTIRPDTAILYRVPLPDGLDGVRAVRTMTTTLAWFSPVNPRHQGYRKAALDVSAASDDKFWATDARASDQPTDKAVVRGTVSHEHRSGEAAKVFVDDGNILLRISCRSAAGELGDEIPFALAVSFEVSVDAGIPVYEQIRERVDIAIRSRVRPGA